MDVGKPVPTSKPVTPVPSCLTGKIRSPIFYKKQPNFEQDMIAFSSFMAFNSTQ